MATAMCRPTIRPALVLFRQITAPNRIRCVSYPRNPSYNKLGIIAHLVLRPKQRSATAK